MLTKDLEEISKTARRKFLKTVVSIPVGMVTSMLLTEKPAPVKRLHPAHEKMILALKKESFFRKDICMDSNHYVAWKRNSDGVLCTLDGNPI